MSEGDVSLIRDEDLLRRMWQQTEDFARKKEIRGHMYRLREERLRNLYSPEPPAKDGKGCEFTSEQGHVKSFADQTFQSMKSKEVRDAGSPPKEFTYRGQDLKELSNAGWNVESENRTSDDGHTHVKSVQANIEGRYDVDGGRGQFAACDQHKQAVTEYQDDNTSLKRNESSSNTSAREQVVRKTDDGTHFSSTTSSSTSASKVQQFSSTKHETVPYLTNDDYDRQQIDDTYRNEQSITRREVTNDYEQSLRRNDLEQGELVSRKIDYPDDNTKIVVETRLLPDGTRVTSTRREFHAPVVHNSRSEQHSQQTKRETQSYKTSSQQKSDSREFTSKVTHQNVDNQCTNIVDSQKTADAYDFKRDQQTHFVDRNDTKEQVDRHQHTTNIEKTNKREVISEDVQRSNKKEHYESLDVQHLSSETKKDKLTEEVTERKVTNDQYQTTYNTDYTQKKISNDWSPTQQAWASTLRADTPTSTTPSTRASSPGTRTFQSSTSSLRSSVSPDKISRKPHSRGGSPTKVDRRSPTRTSSEKYYSTHSSNSVIESKTNRYVSPEGKPSHGRSPTRPSYSPEKTLRTSVSPDRDPNESPRRSYTSPDRKTPSRMGPSDNINRNQEKLQRPNESPDRKPSPYNVPGRSYPRSTSPSKFQNNNMMPRAVRSEQSPTRLLDQPHAVEAVLKKSPSPTRFPHRSSISPEKILPDSHTRGLSPAKSPREKTPTDKVCPTASHPRDVSPAIQHRSPSPARKPINQRNNDIPDPHKNIESRQSSGSPERKPGYMRPTAASQSTNTDTTKIYPKKKAVSPDRKTHSTNTVPKEPINKYTKEKIDHYTFIDEETKMYSHTKRENVEEYSKRSDFTDSTHIERKSHKSPSPMRSSPLADKPDDYQRERIPRPTLRKNSRSPSPPKGPVTFTEELKSDTINTDKMETDITKLNKYSNTIELIDTLHDKDHSVSKYDTYDKKSRLNDTNDETKTVVSDRYDSLTRREKSQNKGSESPVKKTPRQSASPVKPNYKNTQITNDFISCERTTEELNKKTVTKERPRQLITPSTSPTRKPKIDETAPSTGQSSPTTSVSGFIYFSSPRAEQTIVTDLDEHDSYTEIVHSEPATTVHGRPKSLDVKRSPSPSKIPCRSPSPEKRISPVAENLPRKSSLKKPSVVNQVSPTEKPPTNFRISPSVVNQDQPDHIIVKKDRPEGKDLKNIKSKPPLERRETYEERCRKILGMMDDDKNKTISKNNKDPSSSPSKSPTDGVSFEHTINKETTKTQSTTNDFISYEKDHNTKYADITKSPQSTTKVPSRDSSPTKLQDIISPNLHKKSDTTILFHQENTSLTTDENEEKQLTHKIKSEKHTDKYVRSSISPEKKTCKESPKGHTVEKSPKQPENKLDSNRSSPTKTQPKKSVSPDRKQNIKNLVTEKKAENIKSSTVLRQETYDVDESQLLSESTHPREPKCKSPTSTTNKYSPSRDLQKNTPVRSQSPNKPTASVNEKTQEMKSSTVIRQETYDVDESQLLSDSTLPFEPKCKSPTSTTNRFSPSRDLQKNTPVRSQSPNKPTSSVNEKTQEMKSSTVIRQETYNVDEKQLLSDSTHPREPKYKSPISTTKKYSPSRDLQKNAPVRSQSPDKPTAPEHKKTQETKSSTVIRQETYDVDESQLLSDSTLPSEPKCKSPTSTTNRYSPSRDLQKNTPVLSQSPNKSTASVIEKTQELMISEREKEILDRVQQSLRKLSPNRTEKSPSRGKSPSKSTTAMQDTEILKNEITNITEVTQSEESTKSVTAIEKIQHGHQKTKREPNDEKPSSKLPSRNTSPVKRNMAPTPVKSPEYNKSRSISPKKPVTSTERPQSPHTQKTSGIKTRETVLNYSSKKPTSPTKTEKNIITSDIKKSMTKQNSFTKTTPKTTHKINQLTDNKTTEPDLKRPMQKNQQHLPKKEPDTKVARTASDTALKTKKASPQRMKSKPEIQITDGSLFKTSKQITINRITKPTITVNQTKLPNKPKSATSLNTSIDEDDIIIDVQQAKSSRENSPDRICPTPINFTDEVGTPRYPDEVNEPDDEFRQRTYNTIHETETIVDDIIEICEDDELFVKRDIKNTDFETDEYLLSVNDKVSKFTNKVPTTKETTKLFKDVERREHSDYTEEDLKSDECLLTVSEKVNKFANRPRDVDSKSPSRRIVDDYDKNTIYQDDYTKLSVNDKANLFVETAENIKVPKAKSTSKVERPDLTDVDESLKSDDCLLSVSDKVNKFVKTAEQFLHHSQETDEKEKKIKEQHDLIMKKIVENIDVDNYNSKEMIDETIERLEETDRLYRKKNDDHNEKRNSFTKETVSSHAKVKEFPSQNMNTAGKAPTIKITTLRSSEAVKKAKALFENIASTQKSNETVKGKTTKLTDIGVIKKSPKDDTSIDLHPSLEDTVSSNITDNDSEVDSVPEQPDQHINRPSRKTPSRSQPQSSSEHPRSNPTNLSPHYSENRRTKSPMRRSIETTTISKTEITSHPVQRAESPYLVRTENSKTPQETVPGYQRPTKTSQMKEETKPVEEPEVSSRRGSGKFGVELRRTSVERSTISSERRRSVEHHQPCIEDIFDLDLLEQMLEKVVGYEQRRRIRAQIRIARKRIETETDTYTKTTKHTTSTVTISKSKSPDRKQPKSPERQPKSSSHKAQSPERQATHSLSRTVLDHSQPKEQTPMTNGHAKDSVKHRPRSPGKSPKSHPTTKSPVRQPSPDKKTRTTSPSKTPVMKPKTNRFNEYASAYLKKAGINDSDKVKVLETKVKKNTETSDRKMLSQTNEQKVTETKSTISKSFTERTSSKDTIDVVRVNGKRTPSPEKKRSPERKVETPTERLREKSPSPVLKRQLSDSGRKETIIKTVYDIDKKVQPKNPQEEKPSWVTNKNLKKITSETRTFSSKKIESEKPKYRAPSPSKAIVKPIDVITSSYGPGPLDADGKPLFGIKALRNGASNYQVKGTVIRQEFHSRNGSEPEGSVSVTAYSSSPEELERLLRSQGERPSRLHGLAAITTTKKFGGTTGHTYNDIHTKEERAALDQFTHSDRRVVDSRVEISDVTSDTREKRLHEIQDVERTREEEDRRERSYQDQRRECSDKSERTERVERSEKSERTEKTQKSVRREDKKTVRQSSVKSLTEKFIKNASEAPKPSSAYPKAGLILRTATMKDSVSSDSSVHAGLARTDSEHSLGSVEEVIVTSSTDRTGRTSSDRMTRATTQADRVTRATPQVDRANRATTQADRVTRVTTHTGRSGPAVDRAGRTTVTTTTTTTRARAPASFLDSTTKVTGVQDILTRMKNADIVIQEGDSSEDSEARALLNKFLGATVLMAGMQGYVTEGSPGKMTIKETVRSSSGGQVTSSTSVEELDLDQCWDERILRKLLDECTDAEQRRRLRARIRSLMAEQEACATAVTEALAAAGETVEGGDGDAREEEEVTTVTSSVRRNSSEKTISSSTTTKTTKVIESMTRPAPKPVSPFTKFRQLERQNSTNSPKM
ncbi:unnamed protein product [Chilo suppressalis]|uniref:Smoothelin domain-containing protein n=2 Tax=Chilo suppressalis TaxID=168631 RepID=A0ABN8AR77_CHISP|nr:unnamed protein product [Chilo suppressalis]